MPRIARVLAISEALEALPGLGRAHGVPDEDVDRFAAECEQKLAAPEDPTVVRPQLPPGWPAGAPWPWT